MSETGHPVILVPIDFSEHSMSALRRALHLARLLDHDLALLHVVDTSSFVPMTHGAAAVLEYGHFTTRLRDHAKERLKEIAREVDPDQRCVKTLEVLEGRPWQVIAHVASATQPRMIVVGKRGAGAIDTGIGSVAERVVRNVACDVLVVRDSSPVVPKPVGAEE